MTDTHKPVPEDQSATFNPKCNDLRKVHLTASGLLAATVAEKGMRKFTAYRIAVGELEAPEED